MIGIYIVTKNMTVEQHAKGHPDEDGEERRGADEDEMLAQEAEGFARVVAVEP